VKSGTCSSAIVPCHRWWLWLLCLCTQCLQGYCNLLYVYEHLWPHGVVPFVERLFVLWVQKVCMCLLRGSTIRAFYSINSHNHNLFTCFSGMFPLGIVLASGYKFSKVMTFFTICFGWFMFESVYFTELAARYYCPGDNISKFEIRTFHCFHKYNSF
jgi:hypothetical protein